MSNNRIYLLKFNYSINNIDDNINIIQDDELNKSIYDINSDIIMNVNE